MQDVQREADFEEARREFALAQEALIEKLEDWQMPYFNRMQDSILRLVKLKGFTQA